MTTLDTTVATLTANSYATLAELDAYFDSDIAFKVIWDAFTSTVKTQRAIASTRAIDSLKYSGFKYKNNSEQILEHPRWQDYPYHVTTINPKIKQAQAEMIKLQYEDQAITGTGKSNSEQIISSVDVFQTVKVNFENGLPETSSNKQQFSGASVQRIKSLLANYLFDNSSVLVWE